MHSNANFAEFLHVILMHFFLSILFNLPFGPSIYFFEGNSQLAILSFLESLHTISMITLVNFSFSEFLKVVLFPLKNKFWFWCYRWFFNKAKLRIFRMIFDINIVACKSLAQTLLYNLCVFDLFEGLVIRYFNSKLWLNLLLFNICRVGIIPILLLSFKVLNVILLSLVK